MLAIEVLREEREMRSTRPKRLQRRLSAVLEVLKILRENAVTKRLAPPGDAKSPDAWADANPGSVRRIPLIPDPGAVELIKRRARPADDIVGGGAFFVLPWVSPDSPRDLRIGKERLAQLSDEVAEMIAEALRDVASTGNVLCLQGWLTDSNDSDGPRLTLLLPAAESG